MSAPDLDAIRAELWTGDEAPTTRLWRQANVGRHVPALLDEVERLRVEVRGLLVQREQAQRERREAYEHCTRAHGSILSQLCELTGGNRKTVRADDVRAVWQRARLRADNAAQDGEPS